MLPSGTVVLIRAALSHIVFDMNVEEGVLTGVSDVTGVKLGNSVGVGSKVLVDVGVKIISWVFTLVSTVLTAVSVGVKAMAVFRDICVCTSLVKRIVTPSATAVFSVAFTSISPEESMQLDSKAITIEDSMI